MAVIISVTLTGVDSQQYDEVRAKAGWLEQAPTGGLGHLCWWEGDACRIYDAWESEEAFNTFVEERLTPAMAAAGVTAVPEVEVHPAHEVFLPQKATILA